MAQKKRKWLVLGSITVVIALIFIIGPFITGGQIAGISPPPSQFPDQTLFFKLPWEKTSISGDVNNDGILDITDAVYTLNFLFLGGPPPKLPEESNLREFLEFVVENPSFPLAVENLPLLLADTPEHDNEDLENIIDELLNDLLPTFCIVFPELCASGSQITEENKLVAETEYYRCQLTQHCERHPELCTEEELATLVCEWEVTRESILREKHSIIDEYIDCLENPSECNVLVFPDAAEHYADYVSVVEDSCLFWVRSAENQCNECVYFCEETGLCEDFNERLSDVGGMANLVRDSLPEDILDEFDKWVDCSFPTSAEDENTEGTCIQYIQNAEESLEHMKRYCEKYPKDCEEGLRREIDECERRLDALQQ